MRVAVLGAGAIGAYVGAALARGGSEVALIARGAQLAALRARGVTVLSPRGDFSAHPFATDDPAEIGPVDVVFLGLKAYSYAGSGPLLAPLLGDDTAVVAAQNGIPWWYFHRHGGPFDGRRIEAVDPGGATSAAIARTRHRLRRLLLDRARGARRDPARRGHALLARRARPQPLRALPAALRGDGRGRPRAPSSPACATRSGSSCSATPSSTRSACSRVPRSRRCAATPARARWRGRAWRSASRSPGRSAPHPAIEIERRIAGAEAVGEHRTSTLQDLDAGKRLELDALIVAVVELADLTGTPAPTLRALSASSALLAETPAWRNAALRAGGARRAASIRPIDTRCQCQSAALADADSAASPDRPDQAGSAAVGGVRVTRAWKWHSRRGVSGRRHGDRGRIPPAASPAAAIRGPAGSAGLA